MQNHCSASELYFDQSVSQAFHYKLIKLYMVVQREHNYFLKAFVNSTILTGAELAAHTDTLYF